MKSYFLLLRLNLRNLLAGFRGAMRKPNGKIDISRLILYPLALLGMLTLAGFVIFMEFSMFSAFEMLNAPEMLPGLAILLAMVTALLFSVFQMLAVLFARHSVHGISAADEPNCAGSKVDGSLRQ